MPRMTTQKRLPSQNRNRLEHAPKLREAHDKAAAVLRRARPVTRGLHYRRLVHDAHLQSRESEAAAQEPVVDMPPSPIPLPLSNPVPDRRTERRITPKESDTPLRSSPSPPLQLVAAISVPQSGPSGSESYSRPRTRIPLPLSRPARLRPAVAGRNGWNEENSSDHEDPVIPPIRMPMKDGPFRRIPSSPSYESDGDERFMTAPLASSDEMDHDLPPAPSSIGKKSRSRLNRPGERSQSPGHGHDASPSPILRPRAIRVRQPEPDKPVRFSPYPSTSRLTAVATNAAKPTSRRLVPYATPSPQGDDELGSATPDRTVFERGDYRAPYALASRQLPKRPQADDRSESFDPSRSLGSGSAQQTRSQARGMRKSA